MLNRLCHLGLLLGLTFPAYPAYLYTLDYPGSDSGSMQPFTVSFTTASLLTAGDPFSYSAATIFDGSDSWTLTRSASTADAGGHCFLLATAGFGPLANGPNTGCGLGPAAPGQAGLWFYSSAPNLPGAPGVYTGYLASITATTAATQAEPLGRDASSISFFSKLTVTDTQAAVPEAAVPEPAIGVMLATGLGVLVLFRRHSR